LGLGRLLANLDYGSLPPQARDEARASAVTASHLQSTFDEYIHGTASADQAASLEDFGDKPLIVLTAGSGHDAAWFAAQDDLASLLTNSAHRVIDGATHSDLILEEDAAAATSQAILDVVSSVRSAGPLVR
jgi:Ca2+-binding RTX toxin-like protein